MTQAEVFLEFLKSLLHIFFMTPTNFVGVFVFINNLILLFYLYIRLFYRNNLKTTMKKFLILTMMLVSILSYGQDSPKLIKAKKECEQESKRRMVEFNSEILEVKGLIIPLKKS